MTSPNPADVIAEDMRRLPDEARRKLRPQLRSAAEATAEDARRRASWSTRIPPTVKVRTSFRVGREGVEIVAGGPSAPHARPYEGLSAGGSGEFRHPVYADATNFTRRGWTWVTAATRPFLFPAAEAGEERTTQNLTAALDEAAAAIGFGG
ncbi:MAG TPA: hypothetical protein VIQ30_23180 [Pseudonocardia sp.]